MPVVPKCRRRFSINWQTQEKRPGSQLGQIQGTQVHPVVVEVMREVGIDLSDAKPQKLTPALAEGADLLVTMGCGDECPYIPGLRRADWPLPDPKNLPLEEVRVIRDTVRSHVAKLVAEEGVGRQ